MTPPLVVGLTGGIASGKTTVANWLTELGVPVIDADTLARELVTPGTPAFEEVVAAFGNEALTNHGELDRVKLRALVFADPEQRQRLESILHPRIRTEMVRRVRAVQTPYCVLCIPLLLERDQRDLVDRVLVVDAPPELQIARAQARDRTDRGTIEAILHVQAHRAERLAAADDVIANNADLAQLRAQVLALHHRYLRLARTNLPGKAK